MRIDAPASDSSLGVRAAETGSGSAAKSIVSTMRPALATGLLVVFFAGLGVVAATRVFAYAASAVELLAGLGYLAALLGLQLCYFSRPRVRYRPQVSYPALAAQALLVYAPLLHMSEWWLGLPGVFAGSMLLVVRPSVAVVLAAVVALSFGWARLIFGDGLYTTAFGVLTTLMTALIVYGLTRLARLVSDVQAARDELARMAVADERLRFARELHDLLGVRLSRITANGERATTSLRADPSAARAELREILRVSRGALREVRSVARGYRTLSLDDELSAAEAVLTSADVAVTVTRDTGALGGPVATTLAAVLREGVTNVLRHSAVTRCEIAVRDVDDHVRLDIVNEGAAADVAATGGEGIGSLSRRVRALGGELAVGMEEGGLYRLRATLPGYEPGGFSATEHVVRGPAGMGIDSLPSMTRRLANGIVASVFISFGALALIGLSSEQRDPLWLTLGVGLLAAILVLQLGYLSRPGARLRSRAVAPALAAQACLVYAPILLFGMWWLDLPAFLAGSVLLVLPPLAAAVAFVGIVVSVGWLVAAFGGGAALVAGYVATTVTVGLAVYGLTRLARLVSELNAARGELARLAVAEERLRFARDLHDLLGMGFSAITLKAELAGRLLDEHPERAREQLVEILEIARNALGDVRSVASGYRELSLDEEFSTADSVLGAAGINTRIERDDSRLPDPVATVLATVVREGVTNVLRHSKAQRCEIILRVADAEATLEIVNDDGVLAGIEPGRDRDREHDVDGSGIRNLTYRVGSLGGQVAVAAEPDGQFRLRAVVPL